MNPFFLKHWRRPSSKEVAVEVNEVGGPPQLLAAGYNLAALQLFWRGHNFRDLRITQKKCALIASHARGWGRTIGWPSCPGCHWGRTDLSPLEIMFVHWSLSPGFQHGAVHDYSKMQHELTRLEAG